ncbi:hypothetical protein CHUAL_007923 [Chamberlinius hualienensis]
MKTTLTTVFLLAVLALASASPRLNRRQAPDAEAPAGEPAAPPADAPPAADTAAAAPPAEPVGPPASARGPAPPRQPIRPPGPPAPPPPQPAGPSVFVLPDGANIIVGEIREGFTCEGKIYGYYADINNDCKIFHVCVPVLDAEGQPSQPALIFSFFCNNGTLFNQENLVCDHAENVDCSQSETFYSVNQEFGKIPEQSEDLLDMVCPFSII